jgi:hypothetical protein
MACESVQLPCGSRAIVCGPTRRCVCGNRMTRECDWKVPTRRSGTCDAALCSRCTHSSVSDKDLCPKHAAEWQARVTHQPRSN